MKKTQDICDALKNARVKAGIAQGALAKKMGYASAQFVSNWERGICRLPLKKAILFCELTGMSPDTMKELLQADALKKIYRKFSVRPSKRKPSAKKKKKTAAAPVIQEPSIAAESEQTSQEE